VSLFTEGIKCAAATSRHRLYFGENEKLASMSWSDVAATGQRVTAALHAVGVRAGDRVCVLAAHANHVAPVAQGVWGARAAMTMLQQPTPQADLREWHTATLRALRMLGARVVIVGEPFHPAAATLAAAGHHVVAIPPAWPAAAATPLTPAEDDVALYQLTSGSTGDPKAVAISHANLYANAEAMRVGAAADTDADVMLSWLPLSHDMGLVGFLLTPMYLGIKTVYVPPTEFLRAPLNWVRLLSEQAATITAAPNFAYSIVHRRLKAVNDGVYDLRRLRFALCGAEPVDPNTMTEFARQAGRFGMRPQAVVAAYGLAEATLAVSFASLGESLQVDQLDAEEFERHHRAVPAERTDAAAKEAVILGPPLPGMAVKVTDSDSAELPARHLGEILIRGAAVARRYATVEGDVDAIDTEGWLHTGDLGYLTERGEVVVCGRLKNVIIVAGRNIFPSELERIAESADGVRRGAVVAFGTVLPDRREEITVVAETVDRCDGDTSREVRRAITRKVFSATGLSPNVLLVDKGAIPKTPSGKIRHVAAKEKFAGIR